MKYYNTLLCIFVLICCIGCTKRPIKGEYIGVFNYDYPTNYSDVIINYHIYESNKDYILLAKSQYNNTVLKGYDTLFKKENKKFEGRISSNVYSSYFVKGSWSKKKFTRHYTLKGNFTQNEVNQGGEFIFYGTFEIKN